jgi:O-antigen ligase
MILLAIAAFRTLTISYPDRWLDSLIAAALLLTAALTRNLPRPTLPVFALTGIASIAAIQFLAGSTIYRYDTFGSMLFWAALVAACWTAPAEKALHTALAFAAAVAVAVLAHPLPDLTGPFQSRNNAASFLLLFFPIAFHRGLTQHTRRILPLGLAALLIAAIFATGSRAGAAFGTLEIAGLLILCRPSRRGFLAAAGVFAAAILAGGAVLDRFEESTPLGLRPAILASTVHMIRDHPLVGFGLGTFESAYPAYAAFDAGLVVNYAHNDWAQLTAEGGIVAALSFAVVLAAVFRTLRAQPWTIGLLAFLAHALVDYPFARAGTALWFAILLGIAWNARSES